MKIKRKNRLKKLLAIQSKTYQTQRMAKYICNELDKLQLTYTKDRYGNIYCAKGHAEYYPCMVCHIDTVHNIAKSPRIFEHENIMVAFDMHTKEQIGTGGDDKVGIFITLEMLRHYNNFKAVFFLDEECGCIGSSHAELSFFKDCTTVLECDRRGYKDFVNSISGKKLFNDKYHNLIKPILKKYGRNICTGGITDVGEILPKLDIMGANMSCGYYNPHTDTEYIKVDEVELTRQLCIEIFDTIKKPIKWSPQDSRHNYNQFNFSNYKPKRIGVSQSRAWDFYDDDFTTDTFDDDDAPPCPRCGRDCVQEYDDTVQEFWCYSCQEYISNPKI